jgi:guanine nucleotide-binding protein alpha-1 subunit
VLLWKAVCSNKLLAKVELILFMNKCDILDQKLKSGTRLAKYLRSFGDRPNDLDNAQKCTCRFVLTALRFGPDGLTMRAHAVFRSKFSFIHREHSPQPRKFHGYFTSVTVRPPFLASLCSDIPVATLCQDTSTTSGILASGKHA